MSLEEPLDTDPWSDDGVLDNEYIHLNEDGEPIPELFNPVPVEVDPFMHQIKHESAAAFEIVEGELPPGLEMTELGLIQGILPNVDCVEDRDKFSPGQGWYFEDHRGLMKPWGRTWRFKVQATVLGPAEVFQDFVDSYDIKESDYTNPCQPVLGEDLEPIYNEDGIMQMACPSENCYMVWNEDYTFPLLDHNGWPIMICPDEGEQEFRMAQVTTFAEGDEGEEGAPEPTLIYEERWFCIRVHNNWDFDRDNFLAQAPFRKVHTMEVIEEPAKLQPECACPGDATQENFVPRPIDGQGAVAVPAVTNVPAPDLDSLMLQWKEQQNQKLPWTVMSTNGQAMEVTLS